MTKKSIQEKLSSPMSAIGIGTIRSIARTASDPEIRDEIVDLLYSEDPYVARNAAWVITHFAKYVLRQLEPQQGKFIELAMATSNTSLRRLLLNILERQKYSADTLRADFLNFCLEHMIAPEEPYGIQSLCMKLAYKQCSLFPELLDEYKQSLEIMPAIYAPSLMNLRKRFLTKMENEEKRRLRHEQRKRERRMKRLLRRKDRIKKNA